MAWLTEVATVQCWQSNGLQHRIYRSNNGRHALDIRSSQFGFLWHEAGVPARPL
jgi:hypothetical protein